MTYESDRARIEREIRDQIASGQLEPHEQLPSTAQLAEVYAVSMRTVSSALANLKASGLVEGRQGRGYFVADAQQAASSDPVQVLTGEVAELRELVGVLQTHLIELYGRLGQPYPGTERISQQTRKRRATGG